MFTADKVQKPLGNILRCKSSKIKMAEKFIDLSKQRKPNLLQTKLCMRRSYKPKTSSNSKLNNNGGGTAKGKNEMVATTELFIMPMPKEKYVTNTVQKLKMSADSTVSLTSTSTSHQQCQIQPSSCDDSNRSMNAIMAGPEQKLLALTGRIDYAIQIQKQYPQLNVLWHLYGKLLKIIVGKHPFEHILLLRNLNNKGPIMRCIYYDFNNNLQQFQPCCDVRAIVRLMIKNHFQIFKLLPLTETVNDEDLIRIQNVNTFILQYSAK